MNKRMIHLATALLAIAISTHANLLVNGDFEAGNTGFSSPYTYNANGNPMGVYYVGSNSKAWNGNFPSPMYDHTSGSGLMMLVNGSYTRAIIWQETVNVTEGMEYEFSGWASSLARYYPPNLELRIDGQAVGTFQTTMLTWDQFSVSWTATKSGPVTVAIRDLTTAYLGNDFALDDLSFTALSSVAEPVIAIDQPMNSNGCIEAVSPEGATVSAYVANFVDATNIVYSWSNLEGATATGPTFDFVLGLDQSTIVFLTVKDLQTGDEASSFQLVRVSDTTGPSIEIIDPKEGDCFNGNNMVLNVIIVDAVDTNIVDYTVRVGNSATCPVDPESGVSSVRLFKPSPGIAAEPTEITVKAQDASGNTSEATVQVMLQHDNRKQK